MILSRIVNLMDASAYSLYNFCACLHTYVYRIHPGSCRPGYSRDLRYPSSIDSRRAKFLQYMIRDAMVLVSSLFYYCRTSNHVLQRNPRWIGALTFFFQFTQRRTNTEDDGKQTNHAARW